MGILLRLLGGPFLQGLLHRVQVIGALDMLAGSQVLGLGAHVLDFGQLQRAVLLGLIEGVAGDIGVDVDLEGLVVLTDHQAVTDAVEVGAQRLQRDVGGGLADDEHGVESEGDVLHIHGLEIRLLLFGGAVLVLLGHGFAPQLCQHALQDQKVALAASVHHAGLFQHGIHLGGLGQGLTALPDGFLQHCFHILFLSGHFHGPLGRQA